MKPLQLNLELVEQYTVASFLGLNIMIKSSNNKVYVAGLIGAVIASIFIVFIIWVCYVYRLFVFRYCAHGPTYCIGADYILDIEKAISIGYKDHELLRIEENKLIYIPPRKHRDCQLYSSYERVISRPKYLNVVYESGDIVELHHIGNNNYSDGGSRYVVLMDYKLLSSDSTVRSVMPIARW